MKRIAVVLTALALVLYGSVVVAQSGGSFELARTVVGAGGGTSSGGGYTINGSIGQAGAGMLNGGDYALTRDLWPARPVQNLVYLPAISRIHSGGW